MTKFVKQELDPDTVKRYELLLDFANGKVEIHAEASA